MSFNRLLSIDPSLTCSGWALFSIKNGELIGIGNIRSLPASLNLSDRLTDFQSQVADLYESIKLSRKDILICEAATTIIDPSSLIKLEQVRGIFETLARSIEVLVPGRINPHLVHREVLGMKGQQIVREQIKEMAIHAVTNLYSKNLQRLGFDTSQKNLKKNQDIVDAVLLGHVGLNKINSSIRTGVALQELFVVKTEQKRKASSYYKASIAKNGT